ncbi:MBL fold metallo-hydrolase [Paraburkholderia sp. RL18-103-BIB-C]|jgi:hypothetical protein|uniref:MBL fold metallo-hydrolase n=1 Tax=unclassified Paraburkholderia TaxID=2615204 RepID=UPI0038BB528D
MKSFVKLGATVNNPGVLSRLLLVSISIGITFLSGSATAFADSVSQPMTSKNATPDDYFHTGAGARYLRRADMDIVVEPLRGNINVLMGSGGNITVLSGKEGKFLVDAGISKSQQKLRAALDKIGPTPLKYVVNTHWHWDRTESLDEIIAAKPTAAFDAKWGNFVFNGAQFTKMVYAGL